MDPSNQLDLLECMVQGLDSSIDSFIPNHKPAKDSMSTISSSLPASNTTMAISRTMLEQWLQQSISHSTLFDTTLEADHASISNTLNYPLCSISPDVASLVSVNVLYHVYEQYNCLPTRILPVGYDTPLASYLLEVPTPPIMIKVAVSWPIVKHHGNHAQSRYSAGNLAIPTVLSYEPPLPVNVRAYLHNINHLRFMGLASRWSISPQSRPVPGPAESAPSTFTSTGPASIAFSTWALAIYSSTLSDRIVIQSYELDRRAWPAKHCIKKQDQLSLSNISNQTGELSDNVPLFLHQDDTYDGEGIEQFEPSLLIKRFMKWKAQGELHRLDSPSGSLEVLDIEEDLRLLDEEGEFMSRNQMNIIDYKSLCSKHKLQRTAAMSVQDSEKDILSQYIHMEDDEDGVSTTPICYDDQKSILKNIATLESLIDRQGAVFNLPEIIGWATFNTDISLTTSKESTQIKVDPDFVLEQHLKAASDSAIRGPLKQIWPQLDDYQQKRLLVLMARMLVDVWDNFDILDDGSQYDACLNCPDSNLNYDTANNSLEDHEDIHCQTRPAGIGVWTPKVETNMPESARKPPKDQLNQMEEQFMERTFHDALQEATRSTQSQTIGCQIRHNFDPSAWITKNSFVESDNDDYSSNEGFRGPETRPFWCMDDIDTCQQMTTTRARVKESCFAQDKAYILPLRPDSVHNCGSIRPFDFSMDDLLIQVTPCQEPTLSSVKDLEIIGVSRWKSIGPRPPPTLFMPHSKHHPKSSNVFQAMAQNSPYPLIHLFSLPDILCPVQFGGQGHEKENQEGNAKILACTLAKHRPLAAEFFTDELVDKEKKMYHRWMAAWHEHSPQAPKAARTRYEMIKILRRHCHDGKRLSMNITQDMTGHKDIKSFYYRQEIKGDWDDTILTPLQNRSIQEQPSLPQQPSYREEADFAPSSARCIRCRDEGYEQERVRQEKEKFYEACQLFEEMAVDAACHQQGMWREPGQGGRDSGNIQKWRVNDMQQNRWHQLGKEAVALGLGLSNAQQHSLSQLLGLGLSLNSSHNIGLEQVTTRGSISNNSTEEDRSTFGQTTTRATTHPWQLSEEEKAIVEAHLWGTKRQMRTN